MSDYRRLARFYALCETLVFGKTLQRCRTAFLTSLPENVLSLGEGDGRFSAALLQHRPLTRITIIEPDAAMRVEGKKRAPTARWLSGWQDLQPVDAIVMNFVLDSCTENEIEKLLQKSADILNPGGIIIVGDFFPEEAAPWWRANVAQCLTWVMYCFFHTIVGQSVKNLPPIRQLLGKAGWECLEEQTQWRGFIRAQLWRKKADSERNSESALKEK